MEVVLSDDPEVVSKSAKAQEYLSDPNNLEAAKTNNNTIKSYLTRGYEKLLPYWSPVTNEIDWEKDERVRLLTDVAVDENYPYLAKAILAKWPGVDLSEAFSLASLDANIEMMKIFYPHVAFYLPFQGAKRCWYAVPMYQDLCNDSFIHNFKYGHRTPMEWVKLYLDLVGKSAVEKALSLTKDEEIRKLLQQHLNDWVDD